MRFTKMHGIGNDYVYVSTFDQRTPADPERLAIAVSDRHCGIGGDGLILIMPSERADARMRMFNADGSEGEMCGNGIRCVAKYLHDHGVVAKPQVTVETGRGILTLDLEIAGGRVERVRVDMGPPVLEAERIPTLLPGNPPIDAPIEIDGRPLAVTAVSTGNPHAVLYMADIANVPLETLGPKLEHHPAFPSASTCTSSRFWGRAKSACGPGSAGRGSRWPVARGRARSASRVCSQGGRTGRFLRSSTRRRARALVA